MNKQYKIKVLQSVSGRFGDKEYNYTPGDNLALLEVAHDLVNHNLALAIEDLPALPDQSKTEGSNNPGGLPEDIPGYDHLLLAGLETLEKVAACADLTDIDGIGVKTAEAIDEYLNNLE